MTKRDFKFEAKPRGTASVEEVLSHQYSTNAMKLICLLAETKGLKIDVIKETKKTSQGDITIFRLSSLDAQKIWESL